MNVSILVKHLRSGAGESEEQEGRREGRREGGPPKSRDAKLILPNHASSNQKEPNNPPEAPRFDNNVQPTRFLLRGRASDRCPGESPHLLNDFMVWQSERVRTG